MDKDKSECGDSCCCDDKKRWWKMKQWHKGGGGHGALYPLGIFGALFYFLPSATNFQAVVVGIFKAIFWPAFVVFKVLELLKL